MTKSLNASQASTEKSLKIGIVIPLRMTPDRERSFYHVFKWLATEFVDIPLYISDSDGERFNVSEARNRGCLHAINDGVDILMVLDADTTITNRPNLDEAFELATLGVLSMTKSHIQLSARESEEIFAGAEVKNKDFDLTEIENSPGGLWVFSVEVFQKINGWDERFIGWGFEDNSLIKAYEKIYAKKVHRIDSIAVAFNNETRDYTPKSLRKNEEKYEHYEAISSKKEMLEMVSENMVHLNKERVTLD